MGNSEVGHLNLGAGAIVPQDLARIDAAVEDGTLAENEVLQAALRDAPRVHLIGLVSDGGVHSSDRHLKALIEIAARVGDRGPRRPRLHRRARHVAHRRREVPRRGPGLDGRGRRGPDRLGHRALLRDGPRQALGPRAEGLRPARRTARPSTTPTAGAAAAQAAYERDETDEFIAPTTVGEEAQHPARRRRAGVQLPPRPHARDHARAVRRGVRRDRPRRRRRDRALRDARRVRRGLGLPRRLPARAPGADDRARSSRARGKGQLHVAETEKYPHVTYFFNGGEEKPYDGRGARARALPARRPDLRLQARDERARGHRRLRRALRGRASRRSRSSTSPTPTWSATPA